MSHMDPNPLNPARSATVRFNIADGLALAMVAAYILVRVLRFAGMQIPAGGLWLILFVLGLAYLLLFRGFSWARAHLPWRLRNRLIVAYLLIAVVPLLLVLVMALLSLYLLYWHFGAYLLYADIQQRLDQVSETAETVATSYAIEAASTGSPVASFEGQTPVARVVGDTRAGDGARAGRRDGRRLSALSASRRIPYCGSDVGPHGTNPGSGPARAARNPLVRLHRHGIHQV